MILVHDQMEEIKMATKKKAKKLSREEFTAMFDDNEFVDALEPNTQKIIYSKSLYILMSKMMKNGKTPVEAYESCGFDVSRLGEDRAYAAARKAKKMASRPDYGLDPGDYDGSIPRELMGDLTPEELAAYNQARVYYLERVVELQKKLPSILEEYLTSSKKR